MAGRQLEPRRGQGCAGEGSLEVEKIKLLIHGVCQGASRHQSLLRGKPRRWNSAL